MKIKFANCNFNSSSGPNSFGLRLALELKKNNHQISSQNANVELVFIEKENSSYKEVPIVQRIDGIWYDKNQNYHAQNEKIKETYNLADSVIFQSQFDKTLVETFLGKRSNTHIIYNGENIEEIKQISPLKNEKFDKFENVWTTASDWRRRKRLKENIEYFQEFSSSKDCLVVAGNNPDHIVNDDRIFYVGHLPRIALLSLLKRSRFFVSLFYQDHCPNIVIQARLSGCHTICTTSGGIKEIVGEDSTIIKEEKFDFKPCDLKNPPQLNFDKTEKLLYYLPEEELDIKNVAQKYIKVFNKCLKS